MSQTSARSLRCSVVYAVPGGEWSVELEMPGGATLAQAVDCARRAHSSGITQQPLNIDWSGATIGVWGEVRPRETPLRDGDRIEIYRPLSLDPKQGRRQRAQARRQ